MDLIKFQPTQWGDAEAEFPHWRSPELDRINQTLHPCCYLLSNWLPDWEKGKPRQIQKATGGACLLRGPFAAKWQPVEIQVAHLHGSYKISL